jgi:flavin-dependent dehydrogenase
MSVGKVNTVVCGAGIVGLAVARKLAQNGVEVLVIEKGKRAGCETSR